MEVVNKYQDDKDISLHEFSDALFHFDSEFNSELPIEESEDENPFEVLSTNDMMQRMLDFVTEVSDVIQVPTSITRILLNHFKWDKLKLLDCFYERDKMKLFEEARIINSSKNITNNHLDDAPSGMCGICFTKIDFCTLTSMSCGHQFCDDCWCEYLTKKILDDGEAQTISCAAFKCEILISDETVCRLVRNDYVRYKYQQLITKDFVQCSRLLKWCPVPDCIYAIQVQFMNATPVKCRCGHTFCFECSENAHYPISCQRLKNWKKLCSEDYMSINWIEFNTKTCPHCKAFIEKTGGCDKMTCGNPRCRQYFLWSKSTKSSNIGVDSNFNKERFEFYNKHYVNHVQALTAESLLYVTVRKRMEEEQQVKTITLNQVFFLEEAIDVLCSCRRILIYVSVFSYYIKMDNQSLIFEDNRLDLEIATIQLEELLEKILSPQDYAEDIMEWKQIIKDKTKYCTSRKKVLLDHIKEGCDKKWWTV